MTATRDPVIGLIGGSGSVGRTASARLAAAEVGRLRIGGRTRATAQAVADDCGPHAEAAVVDVRDPESVAAFCRGCDVVANCAGPSYLVLDAVARVAFAAGADYVDVGGELPALEALRAVDVGDRTAVFSAGSMPGLSGLLPRLITAGRPLRRLDSYVGGVARFTDLSAADGLLTRGPRFGEATAAMRFGELVPNALAPLRQVTLPGFVQPVDAWPYLTTEAQTLGTIPGVDEVRAYNVFASGRLPQALADAWAQLPQAPNHDDLMPHVPDIVAATVADEVEFGAFYSMVFVARPHRGADRGITRVLLRTTDSYALSGSVVALAVQQVLASTEPMGVRLAAEALDGASTVAALRHDPLVIELTVE